MLGDNDYPGRRLSLGVPGVFLFEPSDNPCPPPFAPVLLALQSQFPRGFDVETAGFFFNAVAGFEKPAGDKHKTADGIALLIGLEIRFSGQFAFK
jgi:hypothetical protein